MEAFILYSWVALIFGVPFAYFAFRALQRWKHGDTLFTKRDYARFAGRGAVVVTSAVAAHHWGSLIAALLLLTGIAWMWFVDWRSSQT